jgi:hypothetical protein
LYVPYGAQRKAAVGNDVIEYHAGSFYGTQCVYFPLPVAREVATIMWQKGIEQDRAPIDLLIRLFALSRKIPILGPPSSLVQHIGFQSSGLASFFHQVPIFTSDQGGPGGFDLSLMSGDLARRLGWVAASKGIELIWSHTEGIPNRLLGEWNEFATELKTCIRAILMSINES